MTAEIRVREWAKSSGNDIEIIKSHQIDEVYSQCLYYIDGIGLMIADYDADEDGFTETSIEPSIARAIRGWTPSEVID